MESKRLRACLTNTRGFAAALLPGACVGSDLTARVGGARSSPPRLPPKSPAAKPLVFVRHALGGLFTHWLILGSNEGEANEKFPPGPARGVRQNSSFPSFPWYKKSHHSLTDGVVRMILPVADRERQED